MLTKLDSSATSIVEHFGDAVELILTDTLTLVETEGLAISMHVDSEELADSIV